MGKDTALGCLRELDSTIGSLTEINKNAGHQRHELNDCLLIL